MRRRKLFSRQLTFAFIFSIGALTVRCARPNYQDINNSLQTCATDACLFSEAALNMTLIWEKMPTEDEAGIFIMRFRRPNLKAETKPQKLPEFYPEVELWMPSMGHGSTPVRVSPVKDADGNVVPGEFKAENVFFIMPGVWEIRLIIKSAEKIIDRQTLTVTI